MTADSGGKENFRLGFLTAVELPDRGYVGGLLVTNHFGRPLEFQCTAPLKPNRTQEILYGPTLVPYILGDLIGRTLIEKIGVKPHLVLTERDDLLPLRDLVSIPVACVADRSPGAEPATAAPSASSPVDTLSPDKGHASNTESVANNEAESKEPEPAATAVASDPTDVASPIDPSGEVAGSGAETSVDGGSTTSQDPDEPAKEQNSAPFPDAAAADVTVPPPIAVENSSDGGAQQRVKERIGASRAKVAAEPGEFRLGRQVLHFHAAHRGDQELARRGAAAVPNDADLREPFERVREALNETAKSGGGR